MLLNRGPNPAPKFLRGAASRTVKEQLLVTQKTLQRLSRCPRGCLLLVLLSLDTVFKGGSPFLLSPKPVY